MGKRIDWDKRLNEYVKGKGGKYLSIGCNGKMDKVEVMCKEGHRWKAEAGNLCRGRWCCKCLTIKQKYTIKEVSNIGRQKGFICLSEEYIKNISSLMWKCKDGHTFNASFNKIQQGRGCPYCSKRVKYTIEIAKQKANEMGGECLSKEYKNNGQSMVWKCKKGHIFNTSFSNIIRGKWCKKCYHINMRKYSIYDAKQLAKENGGECLSTEYINFSSKLVWQCQDGHEWKASISQIKSGCWCALCSKSRTQKRIYNVLKDIFNEVEFNYRGFGWLAGESGTKQEIDIWVPNIKLAIEYDGEGHYFPVNFGGCSDKEAQKIFELTKQRDAIKNKSISAHPNDIKYFIRIPYFDIDKKKINKKSILNILKQYNVQVN